MHIFTAEMISKICNGFVEGDPKVALREFGTINNAQAHQLTFFSNVKYKDYLYASEAGAILINEDFVLEQTIKPTLIRVKNAYLALSQIMSYYDKLMNPLKNIKENPHFIHDTAILEDNIYVGAFTYIGLESKIHKNTQIYPQVFIGDQVEIGENCIIYAGVKICKGSKIGNYCIINAGTVIGSDGFGFTQDELGNHAKIPQLGKVIIEDYVEIGANVTIDRGTIDNTVIKKGVKIDNLVQIAHNVVLGNHTLIAAQTGISGSTKIGNNCTIGGQVGIGGHLEISDHLTIGAKSGITKSVNAPHTIVAGFPFMPFKEWTKSNVLLKKLPDLNEKINALEKKLAALESKCP